MEIGWTVIGTQGGHTAGRQLLSQMYQAQYGRKMPEIRIADRGKPFFAEGCVHFSISHTDQYVFCVLADCPVGIDAEQADRHIRLELSEKILSPSEKERFALSQDRQAALLRLWVLKEAAAKCSGKGLSGYPDHTDFSPDDPRVQLINGCYVAVIEENDHAV